MTLSNAAEIVFLAATVPVLLRFNHDRDGRTDGRTATIAIGGKQPLVAFPLKIVHRGMHVAYGCLLNKYSAWPCRSKDAMIFDIE
mgnify:CR=1 FL=1